jgi:hypothetical protein
VGGYTSLGLLWRLLDPMRGWVAFTFVSHKVLRWLCPFFLLSLLLTNILLWDNGLYGILLLGQLGFYAVSLLGAFVPGRFLPCKLMRLTTLFAGMNGALLVGFGRWLFGSGEQGVWTRTVRMAEVHCVVKEAGLAAVSAPQQFGGSIPPTPPRPQPIFEEVLS